MIQSCPRCGGQVRPHATHRKSDLGHGGGHTAMHGMQSGHPLAVLLGLAGMAASVFVKDKVIYRCERCGHES